jgi:predicted amidohydrolase YtcJ
MWLIPLLKQMARCVFLWTLSCGVLCAAGIPDDEVSLILLNGEIASMDTSATVHTAIAITGAHIAAVGDDASIRRLASSATQVIDLDGAFVMPGFVEGHGHFMSLGYSRMNLELAVCRTWQEIADLVGSAAATRAPGEWIVGRGWHQEKWNDVPQPNVEGYPLHDLLSQLAPNHPVLLTHASGHMAIANAAAMKLAGLDADTKNPAGGEILHDVDGNPTGVLRESAQGLVGRFYHAAQARRTAAQKDDDARLAFELATRDCLSKGVTSFHDAGVSFSGIDQLRQFEDEGLFKLRLHVMVRASNSEMAERLAEYRTGDPAGKMLVVRGIKRMIDGALGAHGAWLLEPYTDLPTSSGLNLDTMDSLKQTALLAAEHNYQLCIHAIGDRANREVLDLYDLVQRSHPGVRELRWRIEHAQHLHPDDIPRFAELAVIPSMQAVHCTSDAPFVVTRLGDERARHGAYAWRSLTDAGARIVNGTDAPVEDVDPIASFHATVTRQLKDGSTFFPEQSLNRLEAMATFTRNAAWAGYKEDVSGTLERGKEADLVVLSRNLLTCTDDEIPSTTVRMTIVEGKIRFRIDPGHTN